MLVVRSITQTGTWLEPTVAWAVPVTRACSTRWMVADCPITEPVQVLSVDHVAPTASGKRYSVVAGFQSQAGASPAVRTSLCCHDIPVADQTTLVRKAPASPNGSVMIWCTRPRPDPSASTVTTKSAARTPPLPAPRYRYVPGAGARPRGDGAPGAAGSVPVAWSAVFRLASSLWRTTA